MSHLTGLPPKGLVDEIANFLRGFTIHLGIIAIGYATLTFVFGDDLWGNGRAPTYDAALSVPWAPQSWGLFAATCGVLIIVMEFRDKNKHLSLLLVTQGIWCFIFSAFFLIDSVEKQTPFGLPGTWIYFSVGVFYMGRARLAWVWR